MDTELRHEILEVGPDRVGGHMQLFGDVAPPCPGRQIRQHLSFAGSKSGKLSVPLALPISSVEQQTQDGAGLAGRQPDLAGRYPPDHLQQVLERLVFAYPGRRADPEEVDDLLRI